MQQERGLEKNNPSFLKLCINSIIFLKTDAFLDFSPIFTQEGQIPVK